VIAPLRRRHRLMVGLLTLTLPALLWAAVTSRESVPIMAAEALPQGAVPDTSALDTYSVSGYLRVGTLEQAADGPTLLVELRDTQPLPRALFYWRPGEGDTALRFVAVASPGGARLTLPSEANTQSGSLVLWDVARGEELDVLPLPATEHTR